MRKPSRKNVRSGIAITTTVQEPCMLQLLVETLAEANPVYNSSFSEIQPGWKTIETSSLETRVSGTVNFSSKKALHIPFATCFVFTCIKAIEKKYDLTWSNSLT